MSAFSSKQVVNIVFAWLGAVTALLSYVGLSASAQMRVASIAESAYWLAAVAVLLAMAGRRGPAGLVRSLCFALGCSCTFLRVVATF